MTFVLYVLRIDTNIGLNMSDPVVAIIGVGYVGLELAIAFCKAGISVIAYDQNINRIETLCNHIDCNKEINKLTDNKIVFTHDTALLIDATHYIIAVPTPTFREKPDLSALNDAVTMISHCLKKNDLVVLESTVYPGATDDIVIPILEKNSGLESGIDFFVGFCPERVVPGTENHDMQSCFNVVSGQNENALSRVVELYEKALPGLVYPVSSMKVAEASKLIENIQRDVNIALMNEYAEVMDKMGISIHDVLDAARTKWNFLPFKPGLVGGHCIPIDPYYLIYQANQFGIKTPLISTARQVNETFTDFIADSTIQQLKKQGFSPKDTNVAIFGLSFKPNVMDTRHTLSVAIYRLLESQGIHMFVYDPVANDEYPDITRVNWDLLPICHAIILAQEHDIFVKQGMDILCEKLISNGVFIDIPGVFANQRGLRSDIAYWGL